MRKSFTAPMRRKSFSLENSTANIILVRSPRENDFLLIDEPTNHLDGLARESVKNYLAAKRSFILVSHDRDLLDACIDHVLVLNRQSIVFLDRVISDFGGFVFVCPSGGTGGSLL